MLYSEKLEPSCGYCRRGTDIGQGEIACIKYGIMPADDFCRSFRYEPTKRQPHAKPMLKLDELSENDFLLD